MFAALRQNLATAWTRLRQGNLAKLFVFEFVVVLLGVLAAQWVADWAGERSANNELRAKQAVWDLDIAESLHTVQMWEVALPCLDARMDEIMRASADRRLLDPEGFVRPRFFSTAQLEITPQDEVRLNNLGGGDMGGDYKQIFWQLTELREYSSQIASVWQQLMLINPALGAPRDRDFSEARIAAAEIKSALTTMNIHMANAMENGRQIGIAPRRVAHNRVPVEDCQQLWREGSIHVDADTGRGAMVRSDGSEDR